MISVTQRLFVIAFLCLSFVQFGYANKRLKRMFNDVYFKTEEELLKDNFAEKYADIIFKTSRTSVQLDVELAPSEFPYFALRRPSPIHIALMQRKYAVAESILTVLEEKEPLGYDKFGTYNGVTFPIPDDPSHPNYDIYERHPHYPFTWLDFQMITVDIGFDLHGMSPIHICSILGDLKCTQLVIEWGNLVTLNTNSTDPMDPLMIASTYGRHEVANYLVVKGAQIHKSDREYIGLNIQPMHSAALRNHPNVLEVLVKHGTNVDVRGIDSGDTPLMCAAKEGHDDAVKMLLSIGADPRCINIKDKHSALSLAQQNGHINTAKIIKDFVISKGWKPHQGPTDEQRLMDYTNRERTLKYLHERDGLPIPTEEELMQDTYDPKLMEEARLAAMEDQKKMMAVYEETGVNPGLIKNEDGSVSVLSGAMVNLDDLPLATDLNPFYEGWEGESESNDDSDSDTNIDKDKLENGVEKDNQSSQEIPHNTNTSPSQPETTSHSSEKSTETQDFTKNEEKDQKPKRLDRLTPKTVEVEKNEGENTETSDSDHSEGSPNKHTTIRLDSEDGDEDVRVSANAFVVNSDWILDHAVNHVLIQLDDGTVHRGGTHSFRKYKAEKDERERLEKLEEEKNRDKLLNDDSGKKKKSELRMRWEKEQDEILRKREEENVRKRELGENHENHENEDEISENTQANEENNVKDKNNLNSASNLDHNDVNNVVSEKNNDNTNEIKDEL